MGNIDHVAHVGGALGGVLVFALFQPRHHMPLGCPPEGLPHWYQIHYSAVMGHSTSPLGVLAAVVIVFGGLNVLFYVAEQADLVPEISATDYWSEIQHALVL